MYRICAVIVTYHPHADTLVRLLAAVRPQINDLVIVDNGSNFDFSELLSRFSADLIELGDNYGIARAQNIGLDHARSKGADFVLLLDHDSIPATDMVEKLMTAYQDLAKDGAHIAAVGPSYLDQQQDEIAPFVGLDGWTLKRRESPDANGCVESDFLIASGSLIAMPVIQTVGPMVDELFIDYVDIEWGLRARRKGYVCYGVFAAKMEHRLGDEWLSFRGRRYPLHSPLRHYYHVRNAVWLCRRPWLPGRWKYALAWRVLWLCAFFSIFAPERMSHMRMMALGFWHGLLSRMGRK